MRISLTEDLQECLPLPGVWLSLWRVLKVAEHVRLPLGLPRVDTEGMRRAERRAPDPGCFPPPGGRGALEPCA